MEQTAQPHKLNLLAGEMVEVRSQEEILSTLDENGRPSFNTLQNYGSAGVPLLFFIFDLLVLMAGK